MSVKKHFKSLVKLCIECDGNPVTIAIRLSKRQVLDLLDHYLPDDPVQAK